MICLEREVRGLDAELAALHKEGRRGFGLALQRERERRGGREVRGLKPCGEEAREEKKIVFFVLILIFCLHLDVLAFVYFPNAVKNTR
jgi:hypothetical protein